MSDKVEEPNQSKIKSSTSASGPYLGTRGRTRASEQTVTSLKPSAHSRSHKKTSMDTGEGSSATGTGSRKKVKARRRSSSKSIVDPPNVTNPVVTKSEPVSTEMVTSTSSSTTFPIGLCHIDLAPLGKAKKYVPSPYAERFVQNFIKRAEAAAAAAAKQESTASTSASSCAKSSGSTSKTATTAAVKRTSTVAEAIASTAKAAATSNAATATSAGASHNESAGAGSSTRTTAKEPRNYRKSKDRPENMDIMAYLRKLKNENAPEDVIRLAISKYFYRYHMRGINKLNTSLPLSRADIFRNTLSYNSARSYAYQIYSLKEAIEYRELKEAGIVDRDIPASVLDEEFPNTSDDESSSESWSDVLEELRQWEIDRHFEEMNSMPRFGISRETDNESEDDE